MRLLRTAYASVDTWTSTGAPGSTASPSPTRTTARAPCVVVRDQSDLHGPLVRVRDLGTTLITVTRLAAPTRDYTDADCR
jgi:hypothetical protein